MVGKNGAVGHRLDTPHRTIGTGLAAFVLLFAISAGGVGWPRQTLAVGPILTSASTVAGTRPTKEPAKDLAKALKWSPCYDNKRYDCSRLSVPLDRRNPAGAGVSLSILRVRATKKSKRLGVLLINPGGPGASGRTFAKQLAENPIFNRIRQSYDIVGWDPRGVGESLPIRCLDSAGYDRYFAADPNPDTPAEHEQLISVTKEFVEGCRKRNGDVLNHVSTADTVADMDQIREALGESTISYAGFSYGTLLGARYADTYPKRVARFVLDGALDPTATTQQRSELHAIGFERALMNFLESCTPKACRFVRKNETPLSAFDRLVTSFEARPLAVKWIANKKQTTRLLGPGEGYTAVLAALYNVNKGWPRLQSALTDLDRGDGTAMLVLFDLYADRNDAGDYRNTSDANAAVNCTDLPNITSIAEYDAFAKRLDSLAPRFGAFAAYSTIVCAFWPTAGPVPKPVRAATSAPIMILGTTNDPATPYVWAESLHRQLVTSRLVRFESDGHTALLSGNSCIRKLVESYLLLGELPEKTTTCRR